MLIYVVVENLQTSAKRRLVHSPEGGTASKLIPAVVIAAEVTLYKRDQPRRKVIIWTRRVQLQQCFAERLEFGVL